MYRCLSALDMSSLTHGECARSVDNDSPQLLAVVEGRGHECKRNCFLGGRLPRRRTPTPHSQREVRLAQRTPARQRSSHPRSPVRKALCSWNRTDSSVGDAGPSSSRSRGLPRIVRAVCAKSRGASRADEGVPHLPSSFRRRRSGARSFRRRQTCRRGEWEARRKKELLKRRPGAWFSFTHHGGGQKKGEFTL
jgi:hypothetical protein